MVSVFQEQSALLYIIVALLIVLIVVGVGVWMRLGDLVDAARQKPAEPVKTGAWRDRPKVAQDPERWRDSSLPPDVARAYYGPAPGAPASERPPEMTRTSKP